MQTVCVKITIATAYIMVLKGNICMRKCCHFGCIEYVFFKAVSALDQIYFRIKIYQSQFSDISFTQMKYSKEEKNKKLIEELFLKLILNIVNFLCGKKIHFSRYKFVPRYVTMAIKIFFLVVSKKDQRCFYHRSFLLFKHLLYEYSLFGSNIGKFWL